MMTLLSLRLVTTRCGGSLHGVVAPCQTARQPHTRTRAIEVPGLKG